jgi:hypothetical protein
VNEFGLACSLTATFEIKILVVCKTTWHHNPEDKVSKFSRHGTKKETMKAL